MKHFLTITAILVIFILSGCSGSELTALKEADAVIEEHPDSALRILQRIDRTNLIGRELPYYALLMTQAMVKNDIPVMSDSLISIAYGKYGDDWRGDRGIRSNFYMGEILFNREKFREAMKFYLAAYEESKRLGNDYWHAKAAERISDLFFYSYNYDEAEKYMMEAAELFGITGRDLNQKYAIASLGILYINNYKENLAENLLDSLYRECLIKYPQDSDLSAFVRRPLIEIYVKQSRIEELTESDYRLLLNSSSYQEEIDNTILFNTYSNLQESFGNRPHDIGLDLQHADMIAFTHEDKALLYYARYRYEKENGNYRDALNLIDSLLFYQCSLTEDILKESVSGSRSSFYSIKADIEHRRYIYLSIILVMTLFVLVLTFILFRIQNRNKTLKHRHELESVLDSMAELNEYASNISSDCMELKATIKEREDRVSNLQNEIEHLERQNSEASSDMLELKGVIIKREETLDELKNEIDSLLKKQALTDKTIENLFKEKWKTLNMLCDQYFELGESEKTRDLILKNIEKELISIKDNKKLREIEVAVNLYMSNLISRLRSQCSFLKENDIRFLTLIYAGYSVRAVCLVTSIKYRNYYLKKSRLSKRILDSNAPDKLLFISYLKD